MLERLPRPLVHALEEYLFELLARGRQRRRGLQLLLEHRGRVLGIQAVEDECSVRRGVLPVLTLDVHQVQILATLFTSGQILVVLLICVVSDALEE